MEAVVQRSTQADVVVESKTDPFRGITVEELNVRWRAALDELSKKEINVTNPDHALEGALCIRYAATTNIPKTRTTMNMYEMDLRYSA